ncbi:MAG: type 2 isopentenyl-diphosphate Delta-isomerase [Saprospiraceae bacterium]|nr:type 2 isopentenyl-diphosphate Delta-isomerase [Saprospiraceae bacterium]
MDPAQKSSTDRKEDHILLAFKSATSIDSLDMRFEYDPVHGVHPVEGERWPSLFSEIPLDYPVWISSMTGGTGRAASINQNLARLCGDYKLGMGLGSCRKLIDEPSSRSDFEVRKYLGNQPLFANLGIAQIEQWIGDGKTHLISEVVKITEATGLVIHLNPLQEAMQTEGDRFRQSPLKSIEMILDLFDFPIIVKEVGQGMGRKSMDALLRLPLEAIELGAFGGTNFAILELLRDDPEKLERFKALAQVGHKASEMVLGVNHFMAVHSAQTRNLILSGGISHFLDAYYLLRLSQMPSIYGMASAFLKHAVISYESLQEFFEDQMKGLLLSRAFLSIKS